MIIQNKGELQQIPFNHLSDIDFQDFMNFYKKCTAKPLSTLSSGKIDQNEYLTDEEIFPSDQSRIMEQAKFTYASLGKAFKKQIKTIEDQGIKEVEALKALKTENQELESIEGFFPKKIRNNEIRNEIDETKKIGRKYLNHETKKYICDFQQYETIRSYADNIYTGKINIDEAEMDQRNLLKNIVEFNNKSRLRTIEAKDKERDTYEIAYALYEGRELILNASKVQYFQ